MTLIPLFELAGVPSQMYSDRAPGIIAGQLGKAPRYVSRTKHIAVKNHHFREKVKNGTVKILPIDTRDQIMAINLQKDYVGTFEYLIDKLLGW